LAKRTGPKAGHCPGTLAGAEWSWGSPQHGQSERRKQSKQSLRSLQTTAAS